MLSLLVTVTTVYNVQFTYDTFWYTIAVLMRSINQRLTHNVNALIQLLIVCIIVAYLVVSLKIAKKKIALKCYNVHIWRHKISRDIIKRVHNCYVYYH